MSKPSQKQLQGFRDALEARARTLRGELGEVEETRNEALTTSRETVEDAVDQAETRRLDEVRSAEERRDQVELQDVNAALARLDAGGYGECIDCGVAIPPARLQVQPAAARCVDCQERAEQAAASPAG